MTERYVGALPKVHNRHFHALYLTPEILVAPEIRSGSGGLGVVAGSFMNQLETHAYKRGDNVLAISFYCSHGYQTQIVRHENGEGFMEPIYEKDPHPDFTEDTRERITITLAGRPCHIAVRMPRDRERKRTAILLLDTDIPENNNYPEFRMITRVLYGERHATAFFSERHEPWGDIMWLRVLQAAVLGLGAYYVLEKLRITWDIVHLNESHPVFFLVHHLGNLLEEATGREHALEAVRRVGRFTNHTVVASGNKNYPMSTVLAICGAYKGFTQDLLQWIDEDDPHNVRMTNTALYLVGPGHANGVSVDHARIANQVWPGYGIFPITNGLSLKLFQHQEFARLDSPQQIPDLKRHLKSEAYENLVARAEKAGWAVNTKREHILDSVLIAWARRCQAYKRPGLMWHAKELELIRTLLSWRWISVAWGGYVHPDDEDMLRDWNKYFQRFREMENVIPVFNYGLDLMAPLLKGAAQIWLNTPQYGNEACGTSWMSAMLNCALVVSMADGAVPEAEHVAAFGSREMGNWHLQYVHDARTLWQTILPFVCKLNGNDPSMLAYLFDAKQEAETKYSADIMVGNYVTKLYQLT